MVSFDPSELAEWTGGRWLDGVREAPITGFCFDSRKIERGDCFIALTNGQRDGHEYVGSALHDGATAALVERPLELPIPQLVVEDTLLAMEAIGGAVRRQFSGRVIGVTGSCGKTSTKEMLLQLLGENDTLATRGNWNNRIGVPMTLFGLHGTEKSTAVVEAGINQPEEMSHLGRMIQADVVLVTNIGAAHLEKLGTLEGVAREKSLLMEYASEAAELILPASAFCYDTFASFADRTTVLAGLDEPVEGNPKQIVRYGIKDGKIQIKELYGETCFEVSTHSPGIRSNAALTLVAASILGIPADRAKKRLAKWVPMEDRGRLMVHDDQFCYIDCYNANPASMADALIAFSKAVPDTLARCYVLGAMNELGSEAERLHAESVEALSLRAQDLVCLVGPAELRAAYRKGLQASAEQIHEAESADCLESIIASFRGAFFVKGSRAFALEQLFPTISE